MTKHVHERPAFRPQAGISFGGFAALLQVFGDLQVSLPSRASMTWHWDIEHGHQTICVAHAKHFQTCSVVRTWHRLGSAGTDAVRSWANAPPHTSKQAKGQFQSTS